MIYPQALPRLLLNRSDLRQSLRRKSVENVVLYHALSRFSRSKFTFAYPLSLPLDGNLAAHSQNFIRSNLLFFQILIKILRYSNEIQKSSIYMKKTICKTNPPLSSFSLQTTEITGITTRISSFVALSNV